MKQVHETLNINDVGTNVRLPCLSTPRPWFTHVKNIIIRMYDPTTNKNITKYTPESVIRHRVHSSGYIALRKYLGDTKSRKSQGEINELSGIFGCECRDLWSQKFGGFGD